MVKKKYLLEYLYTSHENKEEEPIRPVLMNILQGQISTMRRGF